MIGSLRASVSPPNEITGFVERIGSTFSAGVNWPTAKTRSGTAIQTPFDTGHLADDSSVALAVAASIAWAQAADSDVKFATIPREAFVSWVLAWWDYRQLLDRYPVDFATSDSKPTDQEKNLWKQARWLDHMFA